MKILSHQVYRHAQQGLPARKEVLSRYRPHSSEQLIKQAEEIQSRLTAKLEEQVVNEAHDPGKFSPMEF